MSEPPYPDEHHYFVQELQEDGVWIPIYAMEDKTAAFNRFGVRTTAAPHKHWRVVEETRSYKVVKQT